MKRPEQLTKLTRRKFLGLVGMGAGVLALSGCGSLPQAPEAAKTGRTREYAFEAAPLDFEVGGRKVPTWSYNRDVPGPEIRLTEGDTLRVKAQNRLPEETTIHWHGLPIVNAMDGVPNVTQPPIKSGEEFAYEFLVPTSGSYMYHSHVGLQLDRGLYGPLIVEPKKEDLSYDREYTLMLDDWLDGVSGTPAEALERLESSGGMMGGGMEGMGGMDGGMMGGGTRERRVPGGIPYPFYLIDGRAADDPRTFSVRRGEKIRLRIMNPAADTIFHVAVAGHRLTVTHADGLPVEPVEVDAVRLGMGERYDVLLEADNPGVWQVAAAPEGKEGLGRALLHYEGSRESSPPPAAHRPREIEGRTLAYGDLRTASRESFPSGILSGWPDRTHELSLSGGMPNYAWSINGQRYPDAEPLEIGEREWVRFKMTNHSMMPHPMHLHGHFFQVQNGSGRGPYKDTVLVEPHMGQVTFDFLADNPGDWFFHCHNLYHMESGMARVVSYGG